MRHVTSLPLQLRSEQAHIRRILESKGIEFEEVDVSDPHRVTDKRFMQDSLRLDDTDLVSLPPQIFRQQQHRGVSDVTFRTFPIVMMMLLLCVGGRGAPYSANHFTQFLVSHLLQ